MSTEPLVSDTFTLSGEHVDRLRQALKVVAHQARLAQTADYGRNVVDALAETEELAIAQLARLEDALDDDKAEAEELGVAERQRRASYPLLSGGLEMPARPIWRGHLRLALVSCPVALWNAKHDRAAIRFNMINPKTGHRIRMMTVDAETDEELQRRDLVKGYEFRKDQYLLLTDEDFDSVKVESSSVMAIEKFVEVDSIDPIYYASSYYLAPDGDAGRDVYAVLREAIAETGRVALARVVIGQRERTIAVRAMPGGLVAHTLDEQRDINDARSILGDARRGEDRSGDGAAREATDRSADDEVRSVGPRGSLRDAAAGDDRCQAEGRRHRCQRAGGTGAQQCH